MNPYIVLEDSGRLAADLDSISVHLEGAAVTYWQKRFRIPADDDSRAWVVRWALMDLLARIRKEALDFGVDPDDPGSWRLDHV